MRTDQVIAPGRVCCADCGTEQEWLGPDAPGCVLCGAALPPPGALATAPGVPAPGAPGRAADALEALVTALGADADGATEVEALPAPPSAEPLRLAGEAEPPAAVPPAVRAVPATAALPTGGAPMDELLSSIRTAGPPAEAAEERRSSLGRRLAILALAAVLVLGGWWLAGGSVDPDAARRNEAHRAIFALGDMVRRHAVESGRLPDAASWDRWLDAPGDPRTRDPWQSPWVYRLEGPSFSIGTYGADRRPGGEGAAADLFVSFRRDGAGPDLAGAPAR